MDYDGNSGNKLKVISASRRIDMVGCYPNEFVETLEKKCPPEKVHTLVIWTKNPANLFTHKQLSKKIKQYCQLFIHFTITGMGGTILEPKVPKTDKALQFLPQLIALTGTPKRIRFRFDPIVHLILPDGNRYTNLGIFSILAPKISSLNINDVSISWMSEYKKVISRLARSKISTYKIPPQDIKNEIQYILEIADKYHIQIHGCCVPGLPQSRCIDGQLLSELHPFGNICSTNRAKGQRKSCGCTESWDIGWYYKCLHGCLYCYANPV